jgi:integrase
VRGNITRRGKQSWRLKFDAGERDPATGRRRTRFVTVRGTKKDAQRELTRLLAEVDAGTSIAPSAITLAECLRAWLSNPDGLSPKTLERYRQLAEHQIIPQLGAIALQKLRPANVQEWHITLKLSGGKDGRPLSARTVGHAHRVLHRALARAVRSEVISRNVASVIRPPRVNVPEITILTAAPIGELLDRLFSDDTRRHTLYPIAAVALGTGLRRGELCGLSWGSVDLDVATLRVERSLEETAAGLRFKEPKTRHGLRLITLPPNVVETLRTHRQRQLELRLALGVGGLKSNDLVFATPEGSPLSPDKLSRDWGIAMTALNLPRVTFHALRHTHASALISAGLDVLTISRRLGHGSPSITLTVYGHLFSNTDAAAAAAIEAAMRTRSER